jgi:hypothetical protein
MHPGPEPRKTPAAAGGVSTENSFGPIYTPKELGKLWKLSENSIRRLFIDEPGVFLIGSSNPRGRRGYVTLRIPESVALRVWRRRGGVTPKGE